MRHGATNAGGNGEVDICIASHRQEISARGGRGDTDLGTSQCLSRPTSAVALNKPPLLAEHFFPSWKYKLLPVHLCSLLQSWINQPLLSGKHIVKLRSVIDCKSQSHRESCTWRSVFPSWATPVSGPPLPLQASTCLVSWSAFLFSQSPRNMYVFSVPFLLGRVTLEPFWCAFPS